MRSPTISFAIVTTRCTHRSEEFTLHADRGLDDLNDWAQSLKTPEQAKTPGHRNALHFEKMQRLFEAAGFVDVQQVGKGTTGLAGLKLGPKGRWLDSIEEKGHREFYSLYVEAVKPAR